MVEQRKISIAGTSISRLEFTDGFWRDRNFVIFHQFGQGIYCSNKITKEIALVSRSNQDLLAALKRRRAQVGPSHRETSGTQAASESTTPKSK